LVRIIFLLFSNIVRSLVSCYSDFVGSIKQITPRFINYKSIFLDDFNLLIRSVLVSDNHNSDGWLLNSFLQYNNVFINANYSQLDSIFSDILNTLVVLSHDGLVRMLQIRMLIIIILFSYFCVSTDYWVITLNANNIQGSPGHKVRKYVMGGLLSPYSFKLSI